MFTNHSINFSLRVDTSFVFSLYLSVSVCVRLENFNAYFV